MKPDEFRALVLSQTEGKVTHAFETLPISDLPEGDVLISVSHSSLNYKDGLAVTGKGKIARRVPMSAGIDLAGVVEKSDSPMCQPGDAVLSTGFEVGEVHWGGYAEKARLRSDWLIPIPEGMTASRAMLQSRERFRAARLCARRSRRRIDRLRLSLAVAKGYA